MDVGANQARILYISYDGMTDPLGQSQVLPYLRGLSKLGYSFTILSFEKAERMRKEGEGIRELANASKINWVPLTFTVQPPILSKIYDRHRMWRAALELQKKFGFQLIHCRSYVAAEIGLRLKKLFGISFLFDMRGFWADEKVDNGQWDIKNPIYNTIYKHYKRKERQFLLYSDGVISLTEAAKHFLLAKPQFSKIAIDVIPCCADLDHFDYLAIRKNKSDELKLSLGIAASQKVISYLGSIGGWYMMKEMFQFYKLVHKEYQNYVFLILTKDNPELVKQEARANGIDSKNIFVTYSPRNELPTFLSLCSCSIFFIKNSFSKIASSPTKHAELMGMGIPVICNNIGDTGEIINKTKTGLLIKSFEMDNMIKGVKEIPSLELISKEFIRSNALSIFDLNMGIQKYEKVYRRLLSVKSQATEVFHEQP
ncbi:MAG: glycosyltransferase family 4 protein [Flavisolibacter sp.]